MQMWPGHVDEFDMEASRMANMLHAHVPLAMSLCHVDYANLKMQSSLSNHMYTPGAFEGILELRKEKSRDAARSRRGKENYEFYELAKLLPLPAAITSQLDKASIIRLTISYLKLRDFSSHGDPPWNREMTNKSSKTMPQQCRNSLSLAQDVFETHQGTHILQSLDGFAFALSNDGRFLYISETVSIYLGLSQVEMAGSSIFEYIHSNDHKELAEQLGLNAPKSSSSFPSPRSGTSDEGSSTPNPPRSSTPTLSERVSIMSPNPSKGYDRCFCIRMKSTLTKRGVHFKSSGYRVVQIVAHLRPQFSYPVAQKQLPPLLGLVGMAIALPPPTITELIIDNDMFITRLSPQFKVTYCEPRIADMMDITSEDFVNKNLYDYCHAEDLQKLNKAHTDLLNKGQVLTDYYRLMNRHGGYVWIQTCATIICNAKNIEEQNIIAINYVLSGVEYAGCVMNLDQYRVLSKTEPDQLDQNEPQSDGHLDPDRSHASLAHNLDDGQFGGGCLGSKQSTGKASCRLSMTASDIVMTGIEFDRFGSPPTTVSERDDLLCSPETDGRPSNRTDMFPCDRSGTASTKMQSKADLKNSRRKMEKPRKRKRLSDGDVEAKVPKVMADKASSKSGTVSTACVGEDLKEKHTMAEKNSAESEELLAVLGTGGRNSNDMMGRMNSPTPEDLTTGRPTNSPMEDGSSPRLHTESPVLMTNSGAAVHSTWLGSMPNNSTYSQDGATGASTSSVHDLEEAMNKHLPAQPSTSNSDPSGSSSLGYGPQVLGLQKHKSTIQWIGAHNSHSIGSELSASSLLRSLYPNRESVIRTNVYSSRPQYYDIQNALLTPPGAGSVDVYKDSFAAVSLLNHSKTPPDSGASYSGLTNCYSSSPLGIGMSANMAANMAADAYAMTPPSSVSPQESYMSQFLDHLHADRAMMHQYCSGSSGRENSLTMPIRPQAYSLPAAAHGTSQLTAYEHSMPYHATGYYSSNVGMATYNYVAGSNPSHYRDAMKNVNSW